MPKTDLTSLSDEALEAELARRKAVRNTPPKPLATPDFTQLIATVTDGVRVLAENDHKDSDFEHMVYEAAMEAIYGREYWAWHNAIMMRLER